MKIQRMPEDIVPLLNDLIRRITAVETRPLGTIYVDEKIIIKDPDTGVETIIGDLTDDGEERHGIKQWVGDIDPPPVPSSPMVSANLGVFSVAWDGSNQGGLPQAPDFDHINVYGNDGTSTVQVGVIKTKDEVAIVTGATYNVPWTFWLTSVDQNGNESAKSEDSLPIAVTPLVDELDMKEILDDINERFGGVITEAERLNDVLANAEIIINDTKTSLENLENVKLPQVEADIEAVHQELVTTGGQLDTRLDQAEIDITAAEGSLNTLESTTLPALNQRLSDAETEITTTGQQLGSRLDTAESDLDAAQILIDNLEGDVVLAAKTAAVEDLYVTGVGTIKEAVIDKLWADVIRARKITTDQLLVGSGANLIVDPFLEDETTKANRSSLTNLEGGYGRNSVTNLNWYGGTQTTGTVKTYYFSSINSRTQTDSMIPIVEGSKYRFKFHYNSADGGARPVASIVRKDGTTGVTASGFTTNGVFTSSFGGAGSGQTMEAVWEPSPSWEYAYFVPGIQWESTVTSAHVYGGASVQDMTDGSLIVDGSIDADSINTNSIAAEMAEFMKLNVSSLISTNATIDTAVINQLWTDVIRSRKITTDQLLVGQGENLIPWDMSGVVEGFSAGIQGYLTGSEPSRQVGAGVTDGNHMYMVADNVSPGVDTITWRLEPQEHKTNSTSGWIVEPEEEFHASLYVKAGGSYSGTMPKVRIGLYWYNEAGSYISTNFSPQKSLTWSWDKHEVSGKAPATASTLIVYIRQDQPGGIRLDLPSLYRKKGASLIVDGAIEAKHITASESMSAKLGQFLKLDVVDLISTGSATLNEAVIDKLWTDVVHSKKITADMMVVGGTNNLIPNANVINDLSGWEQSSGGLLRTTGANGPNSTTPYMYVTSGGNIRSSVFEVNGGSRVRFKVKAQASASGSVIFVQVSTNGSSNPYAIADQSLTTSWVDYSGEVDIPDDATTAYVNIYVNHPNGTTTTQRFAYMSLIEMAAGELIVDGAITALKIRSDAVETQHILANAVKADKIEAGAIRATHLAIGTGREIASNGSGQTGDNTGYEGFSRADSTISTPGYPGYFYSDYGQGTTNFLTGDSILRIKPNTKYKITVWLRASASGSVVYLEPMVGSTTAGERPTPTYAFAGLDVPTTWTKWTSEITTTSAPSGTMYFRWFLNHSAGSVQNTRFYFTEFSVEEMVDGTIIQDGAITTRTLAANSITAEKVLIGHGANLFFDPLMKDLVGWNAGARFTVYTGGYGSSNRVRVTATSGQTGSYYGNSTDEDRRFPVIPGRSYKVSVWIRPTTNISISNVIAVYTRLLQSTGVGFTWPSPSAIQNSPETTGFSTLSASTWYKMEGSFTVPSDTDYTYAVPGLYLQSGFPTGYSCDFSNFNVTEMASGELIVDGAIDGKTITGALFQTTKTVDTGLKFDSDGFRVYSEEGGAPITEIRPDGGTVYSITDPTTGDILASMSDDGTISGHALYSETDPVFVGNPILGGTSLNSFSTDYGSGVLDFFPRGMVTRGYRDSRGFSATNKEGEILELSYDNEINRAYKIHITPFMANLQDGVSGVLRIYHTRDGSRPTMNSSVLHQQFFRNQTGGSMAAAYGGTFYDLGANGKVRYLFTFRGENGQMLFTTANPGGQFRAWVEDLGYSVPETGISRTGTRELEATAPPAPPEKEPENYTKVYSPTGYRSFTGSGSTYNYKTTKMYQGTSPAGQGTLASMATFPSMTGDLSGANITSIRVYFYFDFWYYNSGGTAGIMLHGQSSLTSSKPSMTNVRDIGSWPKPGGKWVSIPSAYWNGFKNGTYRGVGLGDGTTGYTRYGYAAGYKTRIEIKYTK